MVIQGIDSGAFDMEAVDTPSDPNSISDPLLKFVFAILWQSAQWNQFRNDINNFDKAYKFIQLVLENLKLQEFAEKMADRSVRL